jgi:hypothetical protein
VFTDARRRRGSYWNYCSSSAPTQASATATAAALGAVAVIAAVFRN